MRKGNCLFIMNKYDAEYWNLIDKVINNSSIVIDRPKNSSHPNYDYIIYPMDYGYLAGTTSGDKGGIDIWVGSSKKKEANAIISSIDYIKKDSEIKIIYACTSDEIETIYQFHNQYDGMKGLLNLRSDE